MDVLSNASLSQVKSEDILALWRYPQESDYVDDWQEFRAKIPAPFHVTADFNGDGIKDDVWLMIRRDGNGWGLFAFLNGRSGQSRIIRLETGEGKVQRFGLVVTKPGTIRT
ncbi:MAG TPA: hypothetical protein VFO67_18930 [Gemmatimonadales bacterium]|nr:hypothetical protein [Gemmatimonadales bacterium]